MSDASSFQSAAMDIFSNLNMLTRERSLFGLVDAEMNADGEGTLKKDTTPVVQGWLSKTWKKITRPIRNVGKILSGSFPKMTADVNVITPDYKGMFKTRLFGKMDLSDLIKFSVPTHIAFGSKFFANFKAEMDLSASLIR